MESIVDLRALLPCVSITPTGDKNKPHRLGFIDDAAIDVYAPETLALDHITPVGSGGEHVMGNVQFLHTDVNAAKGTMDQTAFVEMCREITEHTPLQSGSL